MSDIQPLGTRPVPPSQSPSRGLTMPSGPSTKRGGCDLNQQIVHSFAHMQRRESTHVGYLQGRAPPLILETKKVKVRVETPPPGAP